MATTITDVLLRLQNRQFNSELRRSERNMETFKSSVAKLGSVIGSAFAFREIIRATAEQERAVAQLNATLQSTGRFSAQASTALQEYASDLQRISTVGDEVIIRAQGLLLTFTQIGGDVFPRATRAILDMSTAMGTDLKSATLQIGKALNDPVKGVSALAESGIQFTEAQKDMIKSMVDAGKTAEAQAVILKELEVQFGGSAAAARDTFGGAIDALKNSFGDLLEGDGGSITDAKQAVEDLNTVLNDPKVIQGAQKLISALATIAGVAAQGVVQLTDLGERIGFTLAEITGNLDPLDRLQAEIRDLQSALGQPWYNRPIALIMTGDDEIQARINQLKAELAQLSSARGIPTPGLEPAPVDSAAPSTAQRVAEALDNTPTEVDTTNVALTETLELVNDLTGGFYGVSEAAGEALRGINGLDQTLADTANSLTGGLDLDELGISGLMPSQAETEALMGLDSLKDIGVDFSPLVDQTDDAFEKMKMAAEGFVADFSRRLTDGLLTGELSFKGFAENVLRTITEMMINDMFTNFFSMIGGGGAGGGGGIMGMIGGLFGGGRASGGSVSGNKMYLVGEQGPELFMPGKSGTIVPNDAIGGSRTEVTYNINANDARSFRDMLAREPDFIYALTTQGSRRQPR